MPSRARVTIPAVLSAAVVALAACSSTTSGHDGDTAARSSGTPSTPATSTTANSPTGVASATTTGAATPITPTGTRSAAGVGPCTGAQLAVTVADPEGGAASGHRGLVLLFTNTAGSPCTLTGYPGVAATDHNGQAAQYARTLSGYLGGNYTVTLVTVAPHATVSALAEASVVPTNGSAACPDYPGLLVTPPNTTRSTPIQHALPGCQLQVHPVVPGITGRR